MAMQYLCLLPLLLQQFWLLLALPIIVEMGIHHWQVRSGQRYWISSSGFMTLRCSSGKLSYQTQFSWWTTWCILCQILEQALTMCTTLTVLPAHRRPIQLILIAILCGVDDAHISRLSFIVPSIVNFQQLCYTLNCTDWSLNGPV